MGSGSNRKDKDQPLIKVPITDETDIDSIYLGNALIDRCIASFDVKVEKLKFIYPGISVELRNSSGMYVVSILGNDIAVLNKKLSTMIDECSQIGIKYKGIIIEESEVYFARFLRTA
nr:hypothetical protein [Mucilaginibacter sp. L294]